MESTPNAVEVIVTIILFVIGISIAFGLIGGIVMLIAALIEHVSDKIANARYKEHKGSEKSAEMELYYSMNIPKYEDFRGTSLWKSYRAALIRIRGNKCEGHSQFHSRILQLHHKRWMRDGGGNWPQNMQLLCTNCHGDIHPWMFEQHTNKGELT